MNVTPKQKVDESESRLSNEYSFDLYHTGFFHKDNQTYREGYKDATDYYYYEVVPIQGEARMRYWLDRNLGAKSSGMYIEATGGTEYYGDSDAAGGYYKVANYKVYNDPEMIAEVAPPGYRVPQQKVWDAMRNSDRFHTEVNGNHFESYYETNNSEIGKVYFPKAMMMVNGEKLGESRAGYYWTRTASTGTEKEEIGKWLKMFLISGSSTSYINGDVTEYKASVRCINNIPDESNPKRTSFNVNGATHVYLYRMDGTTKVPTTTWPGHVIGNYSTMKDGWFNFAFESTDFDPSELYVIFNFVDEKGIIHTMSKETISNTKNPTEITPSEATGWKVKDFTSTEIQDPSEQNISGSTNMGYWWVCNHQSPQSVYCYSEDPIVGGGFYIIKFQTDWVRDYCHIWCDKGDFNSPFGSLSESSAELNGYRYFVINPHLRGWDNISTISIIFYEYEKQYLRTTIEGIKLDQFELVSKPGILQQDNNNDFKSYNKYKGSKVYMLTLDKSDIDK